MGWSSSSNFGVLFVVVSACCVLVSSLVMGYDAYLHCFGDKHRNPVITTDRLCCCTVRNLNHKIVSYNTKFTVVLLWVVSLSSLIYRSLEMEGLTNAQSCQRYISVMILMWAFTKLSLYFVLIGRVDNTFQGTIYEYSSTLITALYLGCMITYGAVIAMIPFLTGGQMKNVCKSDSHTAFGVYAGFVDICWNITLCWAFVSPLRSMFNERGPRSSLEKKFMNIYEMELELMPLKYTVIVVVTAISTITAVLLLSLGNLGFFMIVDASINQFCLVSMTGEWTSVYWCVCKPLLLCLSDHTSIIDAEHRRQLKKVIEYHSGKQVDLNVGSKKNIKNDDHSPNNTHERSSLLDSEKTVINYGP